MTFLVLYPWLYIFTNTNVKKNWNYQEIWTDDAQYLNAKCWTAKLIDHILKQRPVQLLAVLSTVTDRYHVSVPSFSNRSRMTSKCGRKKKQSNMKLNISLMFQNMLTLYPLTSVSIFSIPFIKHLPRCWQREFCLIINSRFSWWSFPLFSWRHCLFQGLYCWEKLDAGHS